MIRDTSGDIKFEDTTEILMFMHCIGNLYGPLIKFGKYQHNTFLHFIKYIMYCN